MYLFIEYPKCSTCKKAKKFLDENAISYQDRNIVLENPTKNELKEWAKISNRSLKSFFNTSGLSYRKLNLKDKINEMSDDEMLDLLSKDGMLVKRPILVTEDTVLSGFKEQDWKNYLESRK